MSLLLQQGPNSCWSSGLCYHSVTLGEGIFSSFSAAFPPLPFFKDTCTTALPVLLPLTLPHPCMHVVFWKVGLEKPFSSSKRTSKNSSYAAHYLPPASHSALKWEQTCWDGWFWLGLRLLRSSGTVSFLSAGPGPLVNEQIYSTPGVERREQYHWAVAAIRLAQELTARGWERSGKVCVTLFGLRHSAEIFSKMEKRENQFITCWIPIEDEMCWIPITAEIKELVSICV